MAPKQVYGKRAKATTYNFNKFLSPAKDDVRESKFLSKPVIKMEHKEPIVDIAEVEKQLDELELKENKGDFSDINKEEFSHCHTKSRKKGVSKSSTAQQAAPVERTDQVLLEGDVIQVVEPLLKSRASSRKALEEVTDTNVSKKSKRREAKNSGTQAKGMEQRSRHKTSKSSSPIPDTKEKLGEHDVKFDCNDASTRIGPSEAAPDGKDFCIPVIPSTPLPTEKAKGKKKISSTDLGPPMIVSPDIYTTHVMPLLRLSDQCQIIPFESWTSDLDATVDISKIAEASFSEVYRLTVKSASEGCKGVSVLKLVALKTPPDAPLPSELTENERPRRAADLSFQLQKESTEREDHDSWKSNVQDVHSEVRLLQNLDTIPGFTIFRALTILKGRPSKSFGKAWKAWNKSRPRGSKSEFPDPTKKASYDDNQLWAVIEMEDAGTDCGKIMESGGISTIWEVWDIFWGVCSSVAKAEEACKFEHRDLHMDNICIRSSTSNPCLTQRTIANPLKRKLGFSGLETTVIDYTLSRADIIAESTSRRTSFFSTSGDDSFSASPKTDSSSSAEVAYLDLNKDPALFQGDAESEYQYEIYRYMRGVVLSQNPLAQTPSSSRPTTPDYTPETPRRSPRKHFDSSVPSTPQRSPRKSRPTESQSPPTDIWKRFHPKTNLIWAHFILHKLLENLAYAGNEPPHMSNAHITQNVEGIETEEQAGKVWKKAVKMYKILYRVSQKLEPTALAKEGSWGSMTEVIVNALEMRWLGLSDVNGGVWEEFGEGERERE